MKPNRTDSFYEPNRRHSSFTKPKRTEPNRRFPEHCTEPPQYVPKNGLTEFFHIFPSLFFHKTSRRIGDHRTPHDWLNPQLGQTTWPPHVASRRPSSPSPAHAAELVVRPQVGTAASAFLLSQLGSFVSKITVYNVNYS